MYLLRSYFEAFTKVLPRIVIVYKILIYPSQLITITIYITTLII